MKKVQFNVMLTSEDRYRHEHTRLKKHILGFVIQYETKLDQNWVPVIRYDTRHGFAHRDIMDRKGNKRKTPVFATDYNEALTFAEYDIQSNWKIYKEAFLKGD